MTITRELFDACNALKEDDSQWQRIAVAIQAAGSEIDRLTRERDHFQACWNAVAGLRADRDVLEGENLELRSALDALYGARNLTDDNRISVLRRVLGVLNAPRPKVGDTQ